MRSKVSPVVIIVAVVVVIAVALVVGFQYLGAKPTRDLTPMPDKQKVMEQMGRSRDPAYRQQGGGGGVPGHPEMQGGPGGPAGAPPPGAGAHPATRSVPGHPEGVVVGPG